MIRNVVKYFPRFFRATPFYSAATVLMLFASGLLEGVTTLSIAPIIELLQKGGGPLSPLSLKLKELFALAGVPYEVHWLVLVTGLLILLKALLTVAVTAVNVRARIDFEDKLKQACFTAVFRSNWAFFVKERVGALSNTLAVETSKAGNAFNDACMIASGAMKLLVGVALLAIISWKLFLLSLIIVLPFSFFVRIFSKYTYKYSSLAARTVNDVCAYVSEYLGSMKIVKGYSAEQRTYKMLRGQIDIYNHAVFRYTFLPQVLNFLGEPLGFIVVVAVMYLGLFHLELPFALVAVFVFALYRIIPNMSQINVNLAKLGNSIPSLELVDECRTKAERYAASTEGTTLRDLTGAISFRDVTFLYDDRKAVLNGLTLDIPVGKTVALAGISGAGKSTVIDMLMGFNAPARGRVTVDGIDLQKLNLESWRGLIGYVPQDTLLFNDTLFNNIAWGAPQASKEDVLAAARMAYVDEFVKKFPLGYETPVGERGTMLSGGQRQRVALARALIRKPKLLILDEATSALDAESEKYIQELLDALKGTLTVVLIAHRFSTIRNSDVIHLLDNGRVVESGTYQALMQEGGRFKELANVYG